MNSTYLAVPTIAVFISALPPLGVASVRLHTGHLMVELEWL